MVELPPIAILAGGLGTRLRSLTKTAPKSLANVNGHPFIVHQLKLLRSAGFQRAVICAGFLGEQIVECVEDGRRFGLNVQYSFDGPELLGTGGAIRNALPLLGTEFFVIYGDSFLNCDYQDIYRFFRQQAKPALMTVFRNEEQWDASNVVFSEGEIVAYSKRRRTSEMRYIDYGLGVFQNKPFLEYSAGSAVDLATVYEQLLSRNQLAGVEVMRRFYEIGTPHGLEELSLHLEQEKSFPMSFARAYLDECTSITQQLDEQAINGVIACLVRVREQGGRLFILGVGGSAANASHAVNDFRKIAGFEAYAPSDNVSELTARTNDEGWASVFQSWLETSRLGAEDAVLVLSVGGGNLEKNVSPNLVRAMAYAKQVNATILGIVGRDGGYTAAVANACVIIPTVNVVHTTPHSEAFQAIVWHLIVSHPEIKRAETKWESVL